MCTNIIHLVPHNNIKGQVSKVLQECELKGYKSVTFPAIGTGLHSLRKASNLLWFSLYLRKVMDLGNEVNIIITPEVGRGVSGGF